MNMPSQIRLFAACAGFLWLSTAAVAQEGIDPDAEQEVVETIVVTGSRISGAGESVSPVVSVGQTEFQDNPNVQLADFLVDNITANNGQLTLTDESNQSGRSSGARQASVNLWSLGSENSLTLLNGSRVVNAPAANGAGFFVTDANSIIPGIAMQRVDVLLDGGSAIYGTDAIAGVVNFVPRYGFEGIELNAQTELFPDSISDTTSVSLSGLYGTKFSDDRGSFIVAFDYRETFLQDAHELGLNDANVPQFSGSETAADYEDLLFEGGTAYNWSTPPSGMGMSAIPGVPLTDPLCGRDDLVDAEYYWVGEVMPVGIGATDPADEGQCAGYPTPDLDGRDSDRYSIFTALNYEVSDRASVSLEVGYSDRNIYDLLQFNTNTGAGFAGVVPASHPAVLYNASIDPTWASVAGINISGTINEQPVASERNFLSEAQTLNARAGFELAITSSVGLKIGVSRGEAESTQVRHFEHLANYNNSLAGLGGPGCNPATGTPGAGGCEYYNPFISALLPNADSLGLANSDELISWLINPAQNSTRFFKTTLSAVDAIVDVETGWRLGGGDVRFVVGGEYREETAALNYSDALKQDGVLDGVSAGLVPFDGSDTVTGFFAEFLLPFSDTFTMQLAARYDNYDSVGSTTNPKIGFNWKPHDRVTLRAAYGESFKAPTIVHTSTTIGTASIPTGPAGGRRGGHPVATINQGDPDMTPQTAEHWSVGGDFVLLEDKGAIRNLGLSVAYVNFAFDDRIVLLQERDRLPSGNGVGLCGEVENDAYSVFYEFENNDPGGIPCFEGVDTDGSGDLQQTELTIAHRFYTNLALAELDGVDVRLRSRFATGIGDLTFNVGGTYTLNYDIQDNPLLPPVDAVGVTGVLGAANSNVAELRMNASLGMSWKGGKHQTGLTFRYADEILDATTMQVSTGHDQSFDLRHSWDITDDLNLSLTVDNVFENTTFRPNTNVTQLRDGIRSYFLNVRWSQGE